MDKLALGISCDTQAPLSAPISPKKDEMTAAKMGKESADFATHTRPLARGPVFYMQFKQEDGFWTTEKVPGSLTLARGETAERP